MTSEIINQMDPPQKVKTIRSDDFREITQDRVFCGVQEGFFIYVIQNEKFNTNGEENKEHVFVDEVQVKVSPQQMVKAHKLFGTLIEQYEEVFGEIMTLEKLLANNPDLLDKS